jgi:sulfite reductase (ferredoxin)
MKSSMPRPLAVEIAQLLTGNPDFYNLPRKFKISATGCPSWCSYPEINDIGFTAAKRGEQIGYSVRVGGGLSADPHLAVRLDAFILPEQALTVARVITEIFRDQQGLRESRDRARMKHLFLKEGWTAERFLGELQSRLDFPLLPGVPEEVPNDVYRDHAGIHPQRQPGLSYVGASVLRGRMTGEQLEAAAELAERFGSGALRATVSQNLLFIDIPNDKAAELARELHGIGLEVEASSFWRGAVACTGTEFCKLAITETKGFTRWLVDELEERLPEFDQQLKLTSPAARTAAASTGSPTSASRARRSSTKASSPTPTISASAERSAKHAAIARPVGYRCPAPLVPEAIERLLRQYLPTASREKIFAPGSAAIPTTSFAPILPGKLLRL